MVEKSRGARPIPNAKIKSHYDNFSFKEISLEEYTSCWLNWIHNSKTKNIVGLDSFKHADYCAGTSQAFDHYVIKHSSKTILVLRGDFQYHRCISRFNKFKYVDYDNIESLKGAVDPHQQYAMIISAPFSDLGIVHPGFEDILTFCNRMDIPVMIDLAYWGISKNVHIDLNKYPCIKEVAFSLSKPFYTLETHRIGIRFTRDYVDDGISMLNEVIMHNLYSMSLGVHYMNHFSADWNWDFYEARYNEICRQELLKKTDTVIFGLGDKERHSHLNRGIPDNFRVCISSFLKEG